MGERTKIDSIESAAEELFRYFSFDGCDIPESAGINCPRPAQVVAALDRLSDVLFPGREGSQETSPAEFKSRLKADLWKCRELLSDELKKAIPFRWLGRSAQEDGKEQPIDVDQEVERVLDLFFAKLPGLRELLITDIKAAYEGDPAALSFAEVVLAYPGLLAISVHRVAHELYLLNVPIVPRIMSECVHARTGTDIHPGAKIGRGFFIDHATGVVIGETAEIGERVKIYQGVTLGAKSFPLDASGKPIKHIKRHPTVRDDVIIYANATILGGDTVIGESSIIGGNVFITESVPPNSFVHSRHPQVEIRERRS